MMRSEAEIRERLEFFRSIPKYKRTRIDDHYIGALEWVLGEEYKRYERELEAREALKKLEG